MSDVQPDNILPYWFGELEDGWTTSDRNKLWFGALPADDQDMREKLATPLPAHWTASWKNGGKPTAA